MSVKARMILVAATGIMLVAATVFTLRSDEAGSGPDPDAVRGYLGPTPGPEKTSDDYVATKRAYLAATAQRDPRTEAAALVSLGSHVPAPGAQSLAAGLEPTAVWVRFPGEDPALLLVETTIAGAVADAAKALRDTIQAEIDDLKGQVATAPVAERAQLQELLTARQADLAKVNADCGCVYAFAVAGAEVADLKALQSQRGVRLVDLPRPLTADLAGWELAPLVPPPPRGGRT